MARFAGIKNNQVCVLSDTTFAHADFQVIELPTNLQALSLQELIANYKVRCNQLVPKRNQSTASNLKVAFVGNWKMQCGISTYGECLWPQVAKRVGDFKLFIERNENPTSPFNQLGEQTLSDQQITQCWMRGNPLQELASQIKEYDPDIVWINHEFGLFPNARYWLSLLTQLSEYRIIITMHSIFPSHLDKTICEAAMPEIVCHLAEGQTALRNKGVSAKTHLIPHGCYPYSKDRLWNLYKSERTFMQVGFGFRYKQFEHCIRATALLKDKYPDVFFTALFSESPYAQSEHQLYYNDLMQLVNELKVQEQVAIIRGFQSDQVVDSYFRTNQVAVFPYGSKSGFEVFGASGAARLAMAANMPVISSSIPHFSDLPTIKADTPEQIAAALDTLFSNPASKNAQIEKQIKHIEANSWEKIAQQYLAVFEGC
jgi:glycosyltransferase involved in cell wall biosynthesis